MAQQNKQAEALSGRRNAKARDAFQLAHVSVGKSGRKKDIGEMIRLGKTGSGREKGTEAQMRIGR